MGWMPWHKRFKPPSWLGDALGFMPGFGPALSRLWSKAVALRGAFDEGGPSAVLSMLATKSTAGKIAYYRGKLLGTKKAGRVRKLVSKGFKRRGLAGWAT